jgi:hypothetical protein
VRLLDLFLNSKQESFTYNQRHWRIKNSLHFIAGEKTVPQYPLLSYNLDETAGQSGD